jgi:hypothetical protein
MAQGRAKPAGADTLPFPILGKGDHRPSAAKSRWWKGQAASSATGAFPLHPSLFAGKKGSNYPLWIGSIQATPSGFSTGSISRFTTTASLSLLTRTQDSVSSDEALISWCGKKGGT